MPDMPSDSGVFVWSGEAGRTHPAVSLGAFVLDHLRRHAKEADFPAQIDAATGNEMSFPTILELSVQSAESWRASGLGVGKTLVVFARNSEMLFPAVLGAVFQGVTLSGISPTASEGELRHCLALLRPDAILCDPPNVNLARRVMAEAGVVAEGCLLLVQSEEAAEGARTLGDVMRLVDATAVDVASYRPADVGDFREHVAAVFFSSGTTGMPKGVMLSNFGMLMSTQDCVMAFRCVRGERILCTSLMSWVTGIGLLVASSLAGSTRVCDTFTSPPALLASLRRYECNCWFTAPPLMMLVAEAVRAEGKDLTRPPCPKLRAVVVGGTALPAPMEEALARVMHCDIHQTYASTETLVLSAGSKPLRAGSTGKLVPGVRVRFVDIDTGVDIRTPGVPGELRIDSPSTMKGYKDNAEETAQAFDEHGYFCSGDIAYLDADGYLYIVGRLKELLKYHGDKVAPAEVEAVLREHPGVAEACVVGRPDPLAGDVPSAVVVRRPGHNVTEQELQQLVADRLSNTKRLRGGVVFIEQIPKTSNGKVARRNVMQYLDGHPMQELD
ncbi:luciferin 4-monooxygenase-like [Frankliniella occidentalis]|uniref:Luciferin 4-monooxygenase-like n=1 Tax=Frankliniella occidentalis TaxID=133901 RepID=A0A6J1TDT9_FRAOC|nr:luciferin 4-monooxygenase-like [Frankliniella occidentalis]